MPNFRTSGGPNLNSGEPWSEVDDADLLSCFPADGPITRQAITEAAEFLCRNGAEVRQRLRELGRTKARYKVPR